MKPEIRSLIQCNAAIVLLGGTTLFPKLISLPVTTITLYRSVVGLLFLLAWARVSRTSIRLHGRREAGFAVLVGMLLAVHWVTFFHAIQTASVAVGIISLYTFPVFTALIEPFFERRRPDPPSLFRAGLVLMGVALIAPWTGEHQAVLHGAAWGVFSAVLFALRNILVRKELSGMNGFVSMGWQLLIVCLLLVRAAGSPSDLLLDNRLPLLALLGVCFTAMPHALVVLSLKNLTATTFSLIACLQPLYSIAFAMILLAEFPPGRVLSGGMIIIAMAAYESLRVGRKK